jgi:hypothetical protein
MGYSAAIFGFDTCPRAPISEACRLVGLAGLCQGAPIEEVDDAVIV